jgi:subtilase family serine protease
MLSAATSAASAPLGVAVPTLVNLGRIAAPDATKPADSPDNASAPYDPQQMTTAYGVNLISFNGIVGNGAGQTIAIVDAYNDPNIVSDTATFNSNFGLQQFNVTGGPTLQVLNQTGGTTLPMNTNTTVGDWDLEESLDVQWVHSMAPQANVILFEANSNNGSDLYATEVTAANFPGVSVISNSWGGGEYSGETTDDSNFMTPAGHQGVTFLASAGDTGSPGGYPAYSPYVVSVGGTNLQIQSTGTYISESVWNDNNGYATGGGISTQEPLPSYQDGLDGINGASTTNRNMPDVSADADPDSGVSVYDTWNEGQGGGWFQVGGTSLASPLWAGMIAIANQGRALAGESTLNGYTQTLPMLYSLPSTDFHDVTTGSNGTYSAGPGYDLVTGLGTPVANLLVPALAGYGTTAPSVSAPATASTTESTGIVFSSSEGNAITLTDPFSAGAADSLTLSVSHGTLSLFSTTGLTFTSGTNGSSSFTVSGTIASLNTALDNGGIDYAPTSGYTGTDSLVVSLTDPGESLTGSASVAITINPPAPSVFAPSAANTAENTTLAFTGSGQISVSDQGGSAEQLSLSVSHGTLTLGTTTGLTVAGNGTASMTLTGTLTNLDNDLPSLTYAPASNYVGSDTLSLSDKDTADGLTATASTSITVHPLAPSYTFWFGQTITLPENTAFQPPDTAPFVTVDDYGGTAENLTLSVSHGTIDITNATGLTVTGNGTASVNLIGSLTNINNAVGFYLYYYPTTNYVGTDTLHFSDTDTTTSLTGTANVAITIVGFSVTAPSSASLTENTSLTFSSANGNAISVVDNFPGNTSDSLQVSVANGTVILGSTTGLTFTSGANGSSTFTVSGAINYLNAALNGFTYEPNTNYTGSDSLVLLLTDSLTTESTSATVALAVNAIGVPTITAPASATISENGSLVFSSSNDNALSFTDNGAGINSDSLTMSVSHGTLTLGTTNGLILESGSNDSASFTFKGGVSNLNAALASVTYVPTAGYAGSDSLAILVSDPTDGKSGSTSVALTISPLAPSVTAPATGSLSENGSLVFSAGNGNAISVTDAGPGPDSLSLSVTHGTLTLSTTSGLTFTTGSNGSASFTVSGSVASFNAALSGLSYTPTSDYSGSDSLAVSLTDSGDSQSASKTVALTINALAAPSITAPATASVVQNGSLVFSSANGDAISVADSAAGSNSDSLTLSVSHGTLTLSTTSGLTFTTGANGSASFTVTGTVTNLNAALSGLTYNPTSGYTGSDSLAISISDPRDSESASKSVALTVNAFSPPTITAPSAETVAVNGTLTFSSANSDAITVADSGPGASSDSLTLSVSNGKLTLSTTAGLTFTTGSNGSASFTVTGSVANLNAALSGLTYQPTSGYTGSDTLAATVRDSTDNLSASTSVALTVSGAIAPSITAPTTVSTKTAAVVFTGSNAITINDASAGSSIEQLTLQASAGTIKLSTTSGLTFASGANNSASMKIDGTLANLNAALSGLTLTVTAKSSTLTLSYQDLGDGLSGAAVINISYLPGSGGGLGGAVAIGGTPADAVSSTTPPDAETELLGFAAAVELLVG